MMPRWYTLTRVEIILASVVVCASFIFSGSLWYLDRYVADIDSDVQHGYPIEGQDSPGFLDLAIGIANGEGFQSNAGYPETFRSPGYPALVALFLLTGFGLFGIVLLQILLTVCIVICTYRIGKKLTSERFALLAAVLTALSPNVLFHSSIILSDTVFTFLIVLSVYLFFFFKKPTLTATFGVGVLVGLAVLVRPIALLLPLLFALGYALSGKTLRQSAAAAFLLVLGTLCIVLPWVLRNGYQTGVYTVSTVSSYNLAHYNVPQFLEYRYGADSEELSSFRNSLPSAAQDGYPAQVSEYDGAIATRVLIENVVPYSVYHALQTAKFFLSSSVRYVVLHVQVPSLQQFFGLTGTERDLLDVLKSGDIHVINSTLATQGIITLDRILMLFATLLLAVALIAGYRRVEILILLALIAYFAILTGPVSIPRYRLPVEPFMWILVAYALKSLSQGLWKRE